VSFIDCINRGDVEELGALMAEDHQLVVFQEPPLVGREANIEGWGQYLDSFPEYTIHPHRIVGHAGRVAVLGHTTGSHLGLADEEESLLTLIWEAEVAGSKVLSWRLLEDSPEWRQELGLDSP
jgi:hypothetical protein